MRLWLRLVRDGAFITAGLTLAACEPGGLPAWQPAKAADTTPPVVRIVTPADGQRVQGQELTVEVEYADDNSGIAAQSFHALLNGSDYAGAFDQHSRGASGHIRVAGGLPLGENMLLIEIADRAGNVARATARFFNAGAEWLTITAVIRGDARLEPLALSPDGRMLAAGARNGTVRLWTLSDTEAQERELLKAHRGSVSALAFSRDGKSLVSGGWDGTVRVWSLADGRPKGGAVLLGHNSTISSLAFAANGATVVSGSWDGTIRVWSLTASGPRDGAVLIPQPRTNRIYAVAFSPDRRTLASGNWEGTVGLWDVANARPRILTTLSGHLLKVYALAFAPDGMTLASGALDKQIRLWDVSGSLTRERAVLEGHQAEIAGLVFTENTRLLSAARDGVRVWDITSRKTLREIGFPSSTQTIASTAGGRYLAVGDKAGTIYVLRLVDATGAAGLPLSGSLLFPPSKGRDGGSRQMKTATKARMHIPSSVHEEVRIWESLNTAQRERILNYWAKSHSSESHPRKEAELDYDTHLRQARAMKTGPSGPDPYARFEDRPLDY